MHKGRIFKKRRLDGSFTVGIWRCECSCGWGTQYWAWGAVLGGFLQHHWKESFK